MPNPFGPGGGGIGGGAPVGGQPPVQAPGTGGGVQSGTSTASGSGYLAPQAVRSTTATPGPQGQTGIGAGNSSWLQNMSTYLGGLTSRPKGGLYINPNAANPFQGMGQSLTLGNAPQTAGPQSLLTQAEGGNPFYTQGGQYGPSANNWSSL